MKYLFPILLLFVVSCNSSTPDEPLKIFQCDRDMRIVDSIFVIEDSIYNYWVQQVEANIVIEIVLKPRGTANASMAEFDSLHKPIWEYVENTLNGHVLRMLGGYTTFHFDEERNELYSGRFAKINTFITDAGYDSMISRGYEYYFSFDDQTECENIYRIKMLRNECTQVASAIVLNFFSKMDSAL